MDFDLGWLLLLIPVVFALGWGASRLDLRQARRDPRDAPLSYFKGLNLLLNEQHDKAIDAFIEAVQLDPDTVELHFALGNLFRRRGETERAVRVHEHLLARADLPEAERHRAQYALAQDFFKAGLFDRAEAAYLQLKGSAYELEAELALLSLYERSRDWARAGDIAQALEARGTGSFAPRRAHYLCEQALAERAAGHAEPAEALLLQAQALAPAHARARLLEAQWRLAAGQNAEALAAFERLLLVNPSAFNLAATDYAKAAGQAGEAARALQQLQQRYAAEPALALLLAMNELDAAGAPARLQAHLQQQASLNAARGLLAPLVEGRSDGPALLRALDMAAKPLRRHRCAACGFEATHYFWQCPGCLSWDSFPPRPVEELLMDRFVICMKWGTKYGPEYVNRLYGMVARHLRGPFRFVCFTDDVAGIRPEVENFPLPELQLQASKLDGGWRKLNSYQADLYGLKGQAIFLDLDVVIVDDITPFFEFPGDFPIIKDWKRPWRVTGNSSVYRFTLGAHVDVLEHFIANQAAVRSKYRNEQEYLSHFLHEQGKLVYWPKEWCASFKYQCLPPWPLSFWQEAKIPPGCRIVIFHGEVNPPDAIAGRRNKAFSGMVPASWVAEHWRE